MSREYGYNDDILKELDLGSDGKVKAGGRKSRRYMGMGASSILMVFIVLCLTTFAILTLVSALADYRMTGKVRDSVVRYYAADAAVDAAIRDIDAAIARERQRFAEESADGEYISFVWERGSWEHYAGLIEDSVTGMDGVRIDGDNRTITIVTATGDGRRIETVMEITDPDAAERYRVTSRRVIAEPEETDDGGWNFFVPQ
jgi:Tfp pilus assembly protein PilX